MPAPKEGLIVQGMIVALAALLIAGAAPAVDAADLGWMSGRWVSEDEGGWSEEHWTPARAGTLFGISRSGKGEKLTAYEFIRIAPDEAGVLTYWASPGGKPPVPFRLVSASANEAVFENPAHDFPTRVAYRREGERLTATVSGPGGANQQVWRFERR